jgi:hypothetical protein
MIGQGHGHMSDRLALANAIQDAGIERDKAERLATVIFNAIHDNVATKADVQGARQGLTHRSRECAPISPWASIG